MKFKGTKTVVSPGVVIHAAPMPGGDRAVRIDTGFHTFELTALSAVRLGLALLLLGLPQYIKHQCRL